MRYDRCFDLSEAMTLSLKASKELEKNTVAVLLASTHLEEMRAEGYIEPGDDDGLFGDEFPRYEWEHKVETTEIEGLFEVTVIVLWSPLFGDDTGDSDSENKEPVYTLTTQLFDPPVSSTDEELDYNDGPLGGPR